MREMRSLLIAAVSFGFCTAAAAVPATHAVHERREVESSRWVKRGRVPSVRKLPVRIGLAQSNLENAHEYLMQVSDPYSPNYGKLWTAEEVTEAFKPSEEAIKEVLAWLVDHG